MIETASSYNAGAHVMNHELRHLHHYQSLAAARNLEVIDSNITVIYQFVDGKLIPVRGQARAVLGEGHSFDSGYAAEIAKPADDSEAKSSSIDSGKSESALRLENLVARLEQHLAALQVRIDRAEADGDNNIDLSKLRSKSRALENLLNKLKNLKQQAQLENSLAIQQDLLQQIAESAAPENMLQAILGLKTAAGAEDKSSGSQAEAVDERKRKLDYALQGLALSVGWVA